MKNNIFIKIAFDTLISDEKKLIELLTNENVKKEDIIIFLSKYDIENEPASITYMINYLLDKYDFDVLDNNKIPRIRGLKNYYRFHNTKVLMDLPTNKVIVDIDLSFRLKYKDDIRPFTSLDDFIDEDKFKKIYSKSFFNKVSYNFKNAQYNDKKYFILDDNDLLDTLYLALFRNIKHNNKKLICNMYDIFRYFHNKMPSRKFYILATKKCIKNIIRKAKIWLLK